MGRKQHKWLRLTVGAAIFCSLLLADSNLRIVTTEYALSYPSLPAEFDGYRIVQLSDVHGASFGKNSQRLLKAVKRAAPDLIALTGDLADGDTQLNNVESLLNGLIRIAPVYYVSGNHEWSDGMIAPVRELLKRYGIQYLSNEYVILEKSGDSIVLAGVEDPNGYADQPSPAEVVAALPPDSFRILLGHRNDWPIKYPDLPVDLILCGHAHGGMIRLPFLGGLIGRGGSLFPQYTEGVFSSGRYQMVVSRGLGPIKGILRFWNNPELVEITLRKSK